MGYNEMLSRSDVQARVPESVSNLMLQGIQKSSIALNAFRRLNIPTNQTKFPVLSLLPQAYFVSGDTGLKQTTRMAWENKYINVEELAVIIPIPEAVLDDASFDIWGEVRPLAEEAIARKVDAAVFFGTEKPTTWGDAIAVKAADAGILNTVTRGSNNAAAGGLAADFSDLLEKVELDGFSPERIIANVSYKAKLRDVRDSTGQRLPEVNPSSVYEVPMAYPMAGQWPTGAGSVEAITGQFNQGVLGVRRDFTWKILTEAVITDGAGNVMFNLAQQDMVAVRLVFRAGYQVANVINYEEETEANRWPWATMLAP
jgi:HK97 family phage major capsid protein